MQNLMFWKGQPEPPTPAARLPGFHMLNDSTVVMSDYHLCRYDAILGVLLCIGDEADILVLGKDMCREVLPLRSSGTHWLDCSIYTGTSTFLMLSPESLHCRDYGVREGDSHLAAPADSPFTCIHVPQGLTCGAVGHKKGRVSFFRLCPNTDNPSAARPQLCWTTVQTDLHQLCAPFCPGKSVRVDVSTSSAAKFVTYGAVLALDSYPENPNAFVAVVAGVPGVVKWYIDENRLSCFFDASNVMALADGLLGTCRVTPGGVYVAAVTMHGTKVLLWNESKKKRDKSCELYWVVDLSLCLSHVDPHPNHDSFWYKDYNVGMYMARTASHKGGTTNDKQGQMYILVYGQSDIVEAVVRLEDKKVLKMEPIIAQLSAHTAKDGVTAARAKTRKTGRPEAASSDSHVAHAMDNYFNISHVEPCVLSSYWSRAWTDRDLEALVVTSSGGLRPILATRDREAGGVESIMELRELSTGTPWYPQALLLRLPVEPLRELAAKSAPIGMTWDKYLRGGQTLLSQALQKPRDGVAASELWKEAIFVTVLGEVEAMCLSPQTNETFSVHSSALKDCVPWSALTPSVGDLILERALPDLATTFQPTEVILRVFTTEFQLVAISVDLRRSTGSVIVCLDRAALKLDGSTGTPGRPMVSHADLVDASIVTSCRAAHPHIGSCGKSLLLLLEDSSVALVNLSGTRGSDPACIFLPTGLLPGGASIKSLVPFWMPRGEGGESLCVACLLDKQQGVFLWNFSCMDIMAYCQPEYAKRATTICLTAASLAPLPNLSGEVDEFEVVLGLQTEPMPGDYGNVAVVDVFGASLFHLSMAYGLAVGCPSQWCFRHADEDAWTTLDVAGCDAPTELRLKCSVEGGTLCWSFSGVGAQSSHEGTHLVGTPTSVQSSWKGGGVELLYRISGEERCYLINTHNSKSSSTASSPALGFVGSREVAIASVDALIQSSVMLPHQGQVHASSTGVGAGDVAISRLDASRTLEHVSACLHRGIVIAITRDANGWRWLNVLDSRTAESRMEPFATLEFAGEKILQVLVVEIRHALHMYVLGSHHGTIGHFCLGQDHRSQQQPRAHNALVRRCFDSDRFRPTPWTFRGYSKYLPTQPSLKQEVGFIKRLMTLPWEEIALKMESQTLGKTQQAFADPNNPTPILEALPAPHAPATRGLIQPSKLAPLVDPAKAAPPTPATAAPTTSRAPESRYVQLKIIAEREGVSMTEARRMMSENVRKVQERGERLSAVSRASEDLAQQACTFEDLARQLKEKKRSSWLF